MHVTLAVWAEPRDDLRHLESVKIATVYLRLPEESQLSQQLPSSQFGLLRVWGHCTSLRQPFNLIIHHISYVPSQWSAPIQGLLSGFYLSLIAFPISVANKLWGSRIYSCFSP